MLAAVLQYVCRFLGHLGDGVSEGFVDLVFELLRGEGLGEVVVDAGAHRGDNALLVVDGGDHEDGQSGQARRTADLFEQLGAVEFGHIPVGDEHVEGHLG